jgi:hypothetical protein
MSGGNLTLVTTEQVMKRTTVKTFKTTNGKEIDVYVSFADGKDGFNRPNMVPKGYMLHIQPVSREHLSGQATGLVITSLTAYTGVKGMIELTKRFSQKRMDELAATALASDLYKNGMEQVLARNDLQIAPEPAPTPAT